MDCKKCFVYGCQSERALHRIPRRRYYEWLKLIGRYEEYSDINPHAIMQRFRICSIHFSVESILPSKQLQLGALPTLHLPNTDIVQVQHADNPVKDDDTRIEGQERVEYILPGSLRNPVRFEYLLVSNDPRKDHMYT